MKRDNSSIWIGLADLSASIVVEGWPEYGVARNPAPLRRSGMRISKFRTHMILMGHGANNEMLGFGYARNSLVT